MHGVSDVFASEVFRRANFEPYTAVEEQRVPDPDFPTVPFPNPEEKGMVLSFFF
jgi:phosphomannomutase